MLLDGTQVNITLTLSKVIFTCQTICADDVPRGPDNQIQLGRIASGKGTKP